MSEEPQVQTSTPLRPLLLIDEGLWYRLGSMVRQLCVGLVDQAARLHVLHAEGADLKDLLGPAMIAPLPHWRIRRKANLIGALGKTTDLNANLIHVMGAGLMWAGQVLHRQLNIPVTAHISSLEELRAAGRQLRHEGLHLMAVSEPLRKLSVKKLRLPEGRIRLVRPGMRSVEKRGLSTGDQGTLTVFVWAHNKTARSIEVVFKALQKLLTDGRQILAFVIGAEAGEARLRNIVGALGLHSRITFVPEPRLISLGSGGEDVLILPQPPLELSLQTLGALAAGVVVVAAGAGLHDCIRDGETALIYRQDDYGELAMQLDRLLQNRPLARRLADQGRAYVRENHQVSTMVRGVVEVYHSAIAEHAGTRQPAAAAT